MMMHEGDIFRFSYSADELAKRFEPYHCFDGRLVYRDGRLVDTYWTGIGPRAVIGHEAHAMAPRDAARLGTLTFIANLGDLRFVAYKSELLHYDEADCFDLSTQHGCYKAYAVRATAQRSQARMLAEIDAKLADLDGDIRYAQDQRQHITEIRRAVEAGDTSIRLWWSA